MTSQSTLYLFFSELSTLLKSGIPIVKSLKSLSSSNAFNKNFRNNLDAIVRDLEKGDTFSDSIQTKEIFSLLTINMITAGEKSGNLPQICKKISELTQRNMIFKKRIFTALIYPFILLHLAILGPNAGIVVTCGLKAFIAVVAKELIFIYLSVIFIFFIYKLLNAIDITSFIMDIFILKIPVLGSFIKNYTLYQFYLSFYYLYASGSNMSYSFKKTAIFILRPRIKALIAPVLEKIIIDEPLEDALKGNKIFPVTDTNLLITGEKTGTLDEKLKELITIYEERIEHQLKILEKFLPFLIYFLVLIFAAYKIISFYISYFSKISDLIG